VDASDVPAAIAAARECFEVEPGLAYLDAATYGLPPRETVETLGRALERWQRGTADWVEEWDREGEACRALFAAVVGCREEEVALLPSASVGVGLVAAALPEAADVVVPDDEITSVLFPALVAEEARGARIRRVAFADLAAAIGPGTDLVAFSLTRSQDGATADLGGVVAAAARHGARVLVDATHAVPFVPLGAHLAGIDYLVCHGYKHLLCPRGVAFLTVRPERWPELPPWFANWRSAAPLYGGSYGGPLALRPSAARYDVSLAWHAWAGARPSLEAIVRWQRSGVLEEPLALARRLAAGLGLPRPSASIVALETADAAAVAAALEGASVRVAARGGRVRLSTHVWNTPEEIDRVVGVVGGVLAGQ
jgi:selenocysteine lyase/cysteine desulfurase